MSGVTKFIIGGIVTALLAMASHSALGMGAGFVDTLEARGRAALGNAGGGQYRLDMIRDPALQRIAVLSGNADAETKARLLAAIRAVPGMKDAMWAEPSVPDAPATAEAVRNCQAEVDAAINGQTIQFDSGAATIKPESSALLDSLARALGPCAGTTVEVAGHTDPSGNAAANQTLSEARAAAVVTALTGRQVPVERLIARGYGSTQPKVAGRGAAADAANRRIEFRVSAAGAAPAAPAEPAKGE